VSKRSASNHYSEACVVDFSSEADEIYKRLGPSFMWY
jgi:hypothetical protein